MKKECPRCHGEGEIEKNIWKGEEGMQIEMDVMIVCPECNGKKFIEKNEVSVSLPFHVDDPNSIRIIPADHLPERTMILSSDLYKLWEQSKIK